MGLQNGQRNMVELRDLSLNDQPYFYVFIPTAPVAAGATGLVQAKRER